MRREDMADLTLFLAVCEHGSFTGTARKIGLSQSAVSHAIRRLETRLGLRLLARTTRSVSPTEVGQQLIEILQPALENIDKRLAELRQRSERPVGTIRITATDHAAETLLWPALDELAASFPDIAVELSVEGGLVDIVEGRFDAGVRLGEEVSRDMVAIRIGPDMRMAAVATPDYLARRGTPQSPRDLAQHACINMRFESGDIYAWEFEKEGREIRSKVGGQWMINSSPLITRTVLAGRGISFQLEDAVRPMITDGRLVRLLEDWCPPFSGYHLYYPSRRHVSPAFRLLIEILRFRE
ncbi:LysR family transcriptional regulator [Lichenicola cladoniae]|uniref:LysR family transcriptional regulator n=2 Tax=Lichenicola cladoniae TaxID=1484109 RepID=A0A6M8HRH7_9PROT|nr:LysR family transcriptional regulator [Acetobacteraceae bacterium]QKE91083.1 LysR family transcriptional regulator [Lichenicola cladoniae]